MVVFKNKKVFNHSLILRNQGREISDTFFIHKERGFNYRMSNIQAAIGYSQMFKIKRFLSFRKKVFNFYDKAFKNISNFELMPNLKNSQNSGWLYVLKIITLIIKNVLISNFKKKELEARQLFIH